MPIKPENKARYPANWKQIREAILERAKHKCEQCKVDNHTRICRGVDDDADTYMTHEAEVFDADTGEYLGRKRMSDYHVGKMVDIVLTVAHLDHVPENCDGMESGGPVKPVEESNLRAWCQRCHLRYDAAHHAKNAAATRKSRKAIGDLFEQPPVTA
jgi:5-methylcytosine-specific restriction endonuclease McrA